MIDTLAQYAWVIPALPLLAFALITAFGAKLPGRGAYVAIGAMLISLVYSTFTAYTWFTAPDGAFKNIAVGWIPVGGKVLCCGYAIDALTAIMLFTVTLVASMVLIYSVGYMHGDPRYPRYFAYVSLFAAAMLVLVLANNILLFFMSWELVGLTSYLLIGFWFEKPSAMRAAKKAFLVTRVGDVGFMAGLILLYIYTGSFDFYGQQGIFANIGLIKCVPLVGILLFCGAVGKSAQFPLHVWLPDAMEGPTPVSALIHAATMVAAGVYLVARMYPVYLADATGVSLTVMAFIGAFTALFAASIAVAQNDIKKILAYSTISQLGYMIMSLGVFGYVAALFHLMTHAFFKAQLFLGSGSVIHGTETQDIRQMGGLRKTMPVTFVTFLISTLALCGIPLTAGGFSKEEILGVAFFTSKPVFWAGVIGAFATAFYMFRLVYKVFFGEEKTHAHESPKVMTLPLCVLAFMAIASGYVMSPWCHCFEHKVGAVLGSHNALLERALAAAGYHGGFHLNVFAVGTCAALLGIFFATIIWLKKLIDPAKISAAFAPVKKLLENKYYIDEIYNATVIALMMLLAKLLYLFDKYIVDGLIVNGAAKFSLYVSRIWFLFDKYVVDGLVNLSAAVCGIAGKYLRYIQTGVTQHYVFLTVVAVIFAGLVALAFNFREVTWVQPVLGFFRQ